MEEQIANFNRQLAYIGVSADNFYNITFWKSSHTPITCMGQKSDFDYKKILKSYSFKVNELTGYDEIHFFDRDILIVLT